MDTLAMHRTLTDAGFTPAQAEAVVKVLQGGVATKQDLDLAVVRLEGRIDSAVASLDGRIDSAIASLDGRIDSAIASLDGRIDSAIARLDGRIDRLDSKINLILVVAVLAVLAPAVTRLLVG